MSRLSSAIGSAGRFATAYLRRSWLLLALAAALYAIAVLLPGPFPSIVPLTASATLTILAVFLIGLAIHAWLGRWSLRRATAVLVEHDAAASLIVESDGAIRYCNAAARARLDAVRGGALAQALRDHVANPAALLARLQSRAEALGSAREDVVLRDGHVRLSAQRLDDEAWLWRLEGMSDRTATMRSAEQLSLPMMTVSRTGTILFMNEALRRLLGGRAKSLDRVFADLPVRPNAVQAILGSNGPVRARVVEVEGVSGRKEIFLIPVGESDARQTAAKAIGTSPGAISAAQGRADDDDAAERDGASKSGTQASDGQFETLPVALLRLDADGTVRGTNRLARDLLGPPAVAGAKLSALVEGLGRPMSQWLEEAMEGGSRTRPETLRAPHAASDTFVQVTLAPVPESKGPPLIAVLNDATELKTLEAQFVQSQKMQAIGQLAGGVAHDFNNLLTAISGHCDLLLLRHGPDAPDYADLVQINQNANRAASLVGQLLAFSRKQTLRLERIDVRDTLGELTHLLNRLVGERVTLTLVHDPDLYAIRADKRQLEQVIMNLVVNARDAMREGGEIRIETEARTLTEEYRRDRAVVAPGDYVIVRVTDDGAGIPEENLAKIFEPFFSTKRSGEGTGLGLSTAYGIVKQSGGFIFADSVVGSGTTFTLFLPAYTGPSTEAAPTPPAKAAPVAETGGVVLLVEDEAPVRAFASRALQMRGYTVIEAENAEEALHALEDDALKVDVFVTDVSMPGMDGPSWVREALRDRPDARVVFVSGYAEESFAEAQSQIPNSVFLPKPFSLNDLTATVHQQIH